MFGVSAAEYGRWLTRLWQRYCDDPAPRERTYAVRHLERFELGTPSTPPTSSKVYELGTRLASHWAQQRTWLQRMYPAEFSWHLPINWKVIRPGWKSDLYRFFSLSYPKHWAALRNGVLEGVLTWMSHPGASDYLLLAAPEQADPGAVQTLLLQARKSLRNRDGFLEMLVAEAKYAEDDEKRAVLFTGGTAGMLYLATERWRSSISSR